MNTVGENLLFSEKYCRFVIAKHICFANKFMARKHQLDTARKKIETYFNQSNEKSFTESRFREIFSENRYAWGVPLKAYAKMTLKYLLQKGMLKEYTAVLNDEEKKNVFAWGDVDELIVFTGLKTQVYYTYFSSMYLHQLTLQIPKTHYLNYEHKSRNVYEKGEIVISQKTIDSAFSKKQRKSSLIYGFGTKKVILTNGQFTKRLGVIENREKNQVYFYTDLERTLIDIAVRPAYSGGVFEVLEAFKKAKNKVDIDRVLDYLNELNFIYPYHQVIGFYLERAGYEQKSIEKFNIKKEFKFYLTYNVSNPSYSEKWMLYYPKGI